MDRPANNADLSQQFPHHLIVKDRGSLAFLLVPPILSLSHLYFIPTSTYLCISYELAAPIFDAEDKEETRKRILFH